MRKRDYIFHLVYSLGFNNLYHWHYLTEVWIVSTHGRKAFFELLSQINLKSIFLRVEMKNFYILNCFNSFYKSELLCSLFLIQPMIKVPGFSYKMSA